MRVWGLRGSISGLACAFLLVYIGGTAVGAEARSAPSFGEDEVAYSQFEPDHGWATDLLVQDDGRIVVAGYVGSLPFTDFGLVRFLPDGRSDPTFGDGGHVRADGAFSDVPSAVAIDPDGRIVTVGKTTFGNTRIVITRHLSDGTPDSTFGNGNGLKMLNFSDGGARLISVAERGGDSLYPVAVEVRPDGSLLVVGTLQLAPDDPMVAQSTERMPFMLVLRPDGSPDPGFGTNGIVVDGPSALASTVYASAVGTDGRIALLSRADDHRPVLMRYMADGTRDVAFGEGGHVVVADDAAGLGGLAIQPDHRLVVVLRTDAVDGGTSVRRYLPDGRVDEGFGAGGLVSLAHPAVPTAVGLDPDGRFVVAGRDLVADQDSGTRPVFTATRLTPGGDVDAGFGDVDSSSAAAFSHPQLAIAFAGDGSLLAAGTSFDGEFHRFVLARFDADPSRVDAGFRDIAGTTHEDAIRVLRARGVVGGYPDGTFRPGEPVTRGQMAAFLVAGLGW